MKLIGNQNTMIQINIAMRSAKEDNRPIPHVLFSGAAGCGKTSTAKYLASIANVDFISIAYDSIKKRSDIYPLIRKFNHDGFNKYGRKIGKIKPTILFVDEIHGLSMVAQEHLGILMEEWQIPLDKNESKSLPLQSMLNKDFKGFGNIDNPVRWSPAFTLVGATTNDGKLSKPFRDRFKLRFIFEPYDLEESAKIVKTHAERLKVYITDDAAVEIAKRGRGVPRVIVSYLERCRDVACLYNENKIVKELTTVVFSELKIDSTGLTLADIKLLKILYETEVPVGLDNIAVQLNESTQVLSETVEPYLIQRGFLIRGSKGRVITSKGKRYLAEKGHIKIDEKIFYDIPAGYDRGI